MEFTFEVYGKVRGQGRPRSDFKRKRVYKARADREWEESVKEAYINGNGPWFGDRPVSLCVTTHRELPKATPKRIEREADVLKGVEDALNGIAYVDDCQVVDAHVRKMPRTRLTEHIEVTIAEVDE